MKMQAVAVGIYHVRMDPDGRIRLPVEWRRLFMGTTAPVILLASKTGDHVKMVPGLRVRKASRLLKAQGIMPRPADSLERELMTAAREVLEGAISVHIGSDGRLAISRALRNRIGFSGEVVLAGCCDTAEIWPAQRWPEQENRMQATAVQSLDLLMK